MPSLLAVLPLLVISQTWSAHTLGDGFSVSLPGKPQIFESDTRTLGGNTWIVPHPQAGIAVGFTPIPKEEKTARDNMLVQFLAGQMQETPGSKLEKQRDIALHGWPGLEFLLKDADGYAMTRVYSAGDNIYYMSTAGDSEKAISPVAQKLFASFKFPAAMAKGPDTKIGPVMKPFELGKGGVQVAFPNEPVAEKVPLKDNPYNIVSDRFVSRYGNRIFVASVIGLPDEAMEKLTDETMDSFLNSLLDEVLSGFKGKAGDLRSYRLGETEVLSRTVTVSDTQSWGKFDAFVHDKKAYIVFVYMPIAAKDGAEVTEFFKSVQLPKPPAALSGVR